MSREQQQPQKPSPSSTTNGGGTRQATLGSFTRTRKSALSVLTPKKQLFEAKVPSSESTDLTTPKLKRSSQRLAANVKAEEIVHIRAPPSPPTKIPLKREKSLAKRLERSFSSATNVAVKSEAKVESVDTIDSPRDHLLNLPAAKGEEIDESIAKIPPVSDVKNLQAVESVSTVSDPFTASEPSLTDSLPLKIATVALPEDVLPTAALSIPAIPAYRRFAPLLSPRLELPRKFVHLEKLLYALDSVCNLVLDRDQIPVFHRIQKSLENITERNVTIEHLKQLKTLLPDAYAFTPTTALFNGRKVASLMIEFGQRKGSLPQMELESRREVLHQKLFNLALNHHEAFLREQNISLPPNAILKSWHPKYPQDSIPDIVGTDLVEVMKPAKEEQPKQVPITVEKHEKASPPTDSKPTSLLERIKEKQRKAEVDLMLGRREAELKSASSTVMAEFCDTLAFLFASLNKSSIILSELVAKVAQSSKMGLSSEEVVRNIERIQVVVPGWITLGSSGGTRIVRIDRKRSVKQVKEEILANTNLR